MTNLLLIEQLKALGLHAIASQYPEVAKTADLKNQTYEQFLGTLTAIEYAAKNELKIKRIKKEAKIPLIKTIESYDFKDVTGIRTEDLVRLAKGDFLKEAINLVFFGSFGVGKTHLAMALAERLCESGFKCYFTSVHDLIENMLLSKKHLELAQLFKRLDKYDLIVCDELGYIPQTEDGANLFFQLISQRAERKSLLITTNLTYSEWDKVFINQLNTAAAVDRIIHKCETYNIKGPSGRQAEAKKRQAMTNSLTPMQTQ